MAHCHAIGCPREIPRDQLFCRRHQAMLESDVQKALGKFHRPGKPPSKALTRTIDQARMDLLYLQTNGHHVPSEQEFEW